MNENQAMTRALEIARNGWGRVHPNPMVGAVLLRDGQVIGEGYHQEYGGAHAEVNALDSCPDARGATCILNLEPCAHDGKTPPCTRALVEAGIRRVVCATRDPDHDASGGVEQLRDAGIEVEVGRHAEEAASLNASFLWARSRPDRPFVAVKMATSADGYIADHAGVSQWISGPPARDFVHWLRAGFGAIGIGRASATSDDPRLTVRGSVQPRTQPTRVIFSHRGNLTPDLGLLSTANDIPTAVVVDPEFAGPTETALAGTGVKVIGARTLDDGLRELRNLGIESILVEGGAGLVASLWTLDLIDRVYWIQAPIWLGDGIRAFRPPRTDLTEVDAWTVTERRALGDDTLLVMDRELCLPVS